MKKIAYQNSGDQGICIPEAPYLIILHITYRYFGYYNTIQKNMQNGVVFTNNRYKVTKVLYCKKIGRGLSINEKLQYQGYYNAKKIEGGGVRS